MTVRVQRTFELEVPPEVVWEFLADPTERAAAISVVEDFEESDDGMVWHVRLPIPVIDRTVAVRTRDVERDAPTHVAFEGRSKAFRVTGEHDISARNGGSTVVNTFVVEGRLPGVERFFRRNLDAELDNLERQLREAVRPD